MADGVRSRWGAWLGGLAAPSTGNSISDGGATLADAQMAGTITNTSGNGAWRSRLGFWLGGFAAVNAGTNALSGGPTLADASMDGLLSIPGVISGTMALSDHTMTGLLFDPHGVIDTGYLFEADE